MMEEYSDVRAPQWMDFTKSPSPQLSTPDFFDKVHRMHERDAEEARDTTYEDAENADPQRGPATERSYGSAKLREESAMKRTPVKVISPTSRGGEPPAVEYTTYDEVLGDAMRKLDLCKRTLPPRAQNDMNRTAQEPADFKTPAKPAKPSRSAAGFRSLPHKGVPVVSSAKRPAWTGRSVCTPTGADGAAKQPKKKTSVSLSLFKGDEERAEKVEAPTQEAPQAPPDDSVDGANGEERRSEEVEVARDEKGGEAEVTEGSNEETRGTKEELHAEPEESKSKAREDGKEEGGWDAARHAGRVRPDCLGQSLHKVLTWQNHRRTTFGSARRASVCKKYVSLAEAVSRFQNETPKRFRTRSAKECASVSVGARPAAPSHPPRPTVPISPALVSKNRARPVKALNREERELLELEEIRKHRIRANPVPRGVLRGPRPAKQDEAKPTSAPAERQPAPQSVGLPSRGSRSDLATVTTVLVTDADGIVVKREEISSFGVPPVPKSVTRVEPFSFEARSRELQRRKQERLRCQQQDQAAKPEFHARPAPNFAKPPAAAAAKQQQQQQQPAARRQVVPRPFSFDERDKQIPRKKEQLVKQVLEEEKRSRLFRANPAPVFKCVQPAGAKSRLTARERTAESLHEDRKEAEEPAKSAQKPAGSADCPDKPAKKAAAAPPSLPKRGHSFELNTDKRARERREFDEKIRRKELEEEALRREKERQEQEKERQMRAEMRRLAEVRARPMPAFKPPVLVRHAKPLTDPQSPAFASKLRSKQQ